MKFQDICFLSIISVLLMPDFGIGDSSLDELAISEMVDPSGWNYDRAEKSARIIDISEMVDPSGWNYDRATKSAGIKLSSFEHHAESQEPARKDSPEECERGNIALRKKPTACTHANIYMRSDDKCETDYSLFKSTGNGSGNINFIKRFISLLLRAAGLSSSAMGDALSSNTDITITVTVEQLQKLEKFSTSGQGVSLREVDAILSDVIQSKDFYIPREYYSWMDSFSLLLHSKETWFKLGMVGLPLILIWMVLVGHTVARVATILTVAIFSSSYVITYYRMYKEVEIRQMRILQQNRDVPIECRPADMSWLQSLFHSILSVYQLDVDKCQKYHEALHLDPFLEVWPTRVLSAMMADFFLEPSGRIGKAIASFTTGVMGGLPPMYAWIVYLISSVGIFMILVLTLMFLCGGRMKMGNFLAGIEFSAGGSSPPQIAPSTKEPSPSQGQILDGRAQHPFFEAISSYQKGLVLMDTMSARELLSGNSILQHRTVVEDMVSVASLSEKTKDVSFETTGKEAGMSATEVKSVGVDCVQQEGNMENVFSLHRLDTNAAKVDGQNEFDPKKNSTLTSETTSLFTIKGVDKGNLIMSPVHLSSRGLQICRDMKESIKSRGIFTQPLENSSSDGVEQSTEPRNSKDGEDVTTHIKQEQKKSHLDTKPNGSSGLRLGYGSKVQKIRNENGSGDTT